MTVALPRLLRRKRWQLDRGGITHPLRGSTPHYAHAGNVEQQIKLHRQQDSSFAFDPPHPTYDEVRRAPHRCRCHMAGGMHDMPRAQVVLEPGSLMYFPAGCWHRVICEEDSLSVNISLVGTCWADIVTSAYRQLLCVPAHDWCCNGRGVRDARGGRAGCSTRSFAPRCACSRGQTPRRGWKRC